MYYLPGQSGWGATFAGSPTAVWVPTFAEWVDLSGLASQFPNACGEQDDPDQDGLGNLAEWKAGTDPLNAQSTLAFEAAARPEALSTEDQTPLAEGQFGLYFQSVPGKAYDVLFADKASGTWAVAQTLTATTQQKRVVFERPAGQAFYRIKLHE
jgi:hypothetical protein